MTHQKNLLELVELYEKTIELQTDLIRELAALAKRQAVELHHLRQMDELLDDKTTDEERKIVEEHLSKFPDFERDIGYTDTDDDE